MVSRTREMARRVVPFRVRLELLRLIRLPRWLIERPTIARHRASDANGFQHLLAAHSSPLERVPGAIDPTLQRGKERNVTLAADRIDHLIVEPNETFSHHHTVGRVSRWRGFRNGLELRNGESSASVGGGLCQVSNSFYWVAVRAGMRITERHRHGLDLFADHERTVPFGCGATVVYNYADFRFENPLAIPVMLAARIEDGSFVSELWSEQDPGIAVEIEEFDHRFFLEEDQWWRENRIRRRIRDSAGALILDQEVAHNIGQVLYQPDGVQ